MCNKEDDDWMAALKFIPELFVTCKMLEKFYDTLLANDNILFFKQRF